MAIFKRQKKENTADPVLQNIATSDTVPWFKKKNLRFLYFLLFPTCMGIEITSGFDSQMMNALQMNDYWVNCELARCRFFVTKPSNTSSKSLMIRKAPSRGL